MPLLLRIPLLCLNILPAIARLLLCTSFFMASLPSAWSAETSMETTEIRGELFARQFTTLSGEIAARILKIPFRQGDVFKQQETIVTFDCTVQQAKLARAKAILNAERSKARVLVKLDKLNVTSKLELTNALAEEAKAKAELAIIRAEIKHCQIIAPFAGQVVTQAVQEHQYVKAGQTLLEIHNPKLLDLRFNIPSNWLQHFQRGNKFLVRIHETSRSYPAKITGFGARIDAVNQVVEVTSEIIGYFQELKPGMSGRVRLKVGK